MKNHRSERLLRWAAALLSICLTFAALYALYWKKKLVPFGPGTLMIDDADWQYLDFFAYLKDALAGKNSIAYTFSKGIGGSGVALFAYYLASPLNLLVVFFDKGDLHAFSAMLYALKLSLAAGFFACFLSARFFRRRFGVEQLTVTVLLSMSYALGQYGIAQASNIMWLDGVYMLPLIMLGTWQVARGGRIWKLTLPVALAILFNWYSAGADCVFSILYFGFELAVAMIESGKSRDWRHALTALVRYGVAMALGVLISAGLFFPTVLALSGTSKGSISLGALLDFGLVGNPLNTLAKLAPGSESSEGSVALCCGSFALVGCVSVFMLKSLPRWKRNACVAAAAVALAMFYWNPLVLMFSLLKRFDSYWYRYSHVGIATMACLAAVFFADEKTSGREKAGIALKSMPMILVAGFAVSLARKETLDLISRGLRWFMLAGAATALFLACRDKKALIRAATALLCAAMVVPDIAYNAALLMDEYSDKFVEMYQRYGAENRRQIAAIQEADDGPCRITQTYTRRMYNQNTAMYDEPIGNGYWSNVIYASTVDEPQMQFLDRMGYPQWESTLNVANTCQLGVDSLLSVKYVLSKYPINGLVQTDLQPGIDGKATYENPYCLPFALRYIESDGAGEAGNPFEYQNAVYSRLLGEPANIYIPLTFTRSDYDAAWGEPTTYMIDIPQGEYAVYGNLPWRKKYKAYLNLNGRERSYYAAWLCPNVFYIPTEIGDTSAYVAVQTDNPEKFNVTDEQFYAVDLNAFREVTQALSRRAAENIVVKNGYAAFTATADGDGERLFVSIPYDAGWTVVRNGERLEIDPQRDVFEDCLYAIPLRAGENVIEMTYRVPHLKLFAAMSALGVLLLAALELWRTWTERRSGVNRTRRGA